MQLGGIGTGKQWWIQDLPKEGADYEKRVWGGAF